MNPCAKKHKDNRSQASTETFSKNRTEQPELIRAWVEDHNAEALAKLIKNYQPMFGGQVKQILAGRAVSQEHRDDLMQECTLSFITALQAFDEEKTPSLAAFAQSHIRGALLQYSLDFRSSYRIGRGSDERKAYYAAQKLRSKKAGTGDGTINEVDIESISKSTGSSMKATRRAVESTQTSMASLDEQHENLTSGDHGEVFIDDSARKRAMEVVTEFLSNISQRNRRIIEMSFLSEDDHSNVDLSETFEVSPERIGQIKRDVLKGLANHLNEAGLTIDDIL